MARTKIFIDLNKVRELASLGLTRDQVSYSLGINPHTYSNRIKDEPEIEEAYQAGKTEGVKKVANKLLEKAMTGDNTAMIFFLKCNGWKETQELNIKSETVQKDIKDLSFEELVALAKDPKKKKDGSTDE